MISNLKKKMKINDTKYKIINNHMDLFDLAISYLELFLIICLIYLLVKKSHVDHQQEKLKSQVRKLKDRIKATNNVNENLVHLVDKIKENKKTIDYNTVIVCKTKTGLLHNDLQCPGKKRVKLMHLDRSMYEDMMSMICKNCKTTTPLFCYREIDDDFEMVDVYMTDSGTKIHTSDTCRYLTDTTHNHQLRYSHLKMLERFVCENC